MISRKRLKKHKGFTLIETIITLGIFSLILSSSFTINVTNKSETQNQETYKIIDDISDILTYSTMYCGTVGEIGTIYYDAKKRIIIFYSGKVSQEIIIPKYCKVRINTPSQNMIKIDSSGNFSSKGTIDLKFDNGINVKFSLAVRFFNVNIKKL